MNNLIEYFLLEQDKRYLKVPVLLDVFKKIDKRSINRQDGYKIKDITIFNLRKEEKIQFIDILDNQLFIVSKDMKNILGKYDEDIMFKNIVLLDHVEKKQGNYVLPIFEEVDGLSEKSIFNMNKTIVKKIVLDGKKVQGKKIFKIKGGDKPLIVVRLDVAESLLRRGFTGIKLTPLEVSEG